MYNALNAFRLQSRMQMERGCFSPCVHFAMCWPVAVTTQAGLSLHISKDGHVSSFVPQGWCKQNNKKHLQ